ncbi:serine-repeat antigen [Plasmodium brasilianum]|uniref:Serine-repeat antigen n=1 Tax=Plasmodium brasilianum TaxID=5824 RepID=A0ACB9YF84_PLABR|nr:serine-repeat antigen [Plasmodium brasilianum]
MKYGILYIFMICISFGSNTIKCTTVSVSDNRGNEASEQPLQPAQPGPQTHEPSNSQVQNSSNPNISDLTVTTPPVAQNLSHETPKNGSSQSPPQNGPLLSSPSAVNNGQPNVSSGGAVSPNLSSAGNSNGATQLSAESQNGAVSPKVPNYHNMAKIESALLKNHTGVRITGPCNEEVGVFLIPYIYITVKSKTDNIELSSKFPQSDNEVLEFKKEKEELQNKCGQDSKKTFKFIIYIQQDVLTLKWKVYPSEPSSDASNIKADVRKYKIPKLETPITSIQVHTAAVEEGKAFLKSKDYSIKNDIPVKCEQIASACFLSGNTDIEKCYTCNLLIQNTPTSDKCFNYVSSDIKENLNDIEIIAQDDEGSNEYKLTESISNIMKSIYKTDKGNKKELKKFEDLDDISKAELMNYCMLLKEVDTNGTLEMNELGKETDVFNNISRLLKNHIQENNTALVKKLKNAAMCMKYIDNWVVNKTGLILPELSYKKLENTNDVYLNENGELQIHKNGYGHIDKEGDNNKGDLTNVDKDSKVLSIPVTNGMFCNEEYCDRWKDKNSCVSKIEAQDQGSCATSWIFASKLHLETIRCMKGYEHASSSALYVANCANKEAKDKCHVGSNPLEFLKIIDENKFLPLEVNLPYSYANVGNECPNPQNHWTNLWANVELLDSKDEPNSLGAKGYTAYESDKFRGNMETFIKKIKHEVMHKGSVIAYVKVENVMGYDLNGKKVLSVCGDKNADHAVNIIGWGNYINDEGKKKSYWIVRNSWGMYWGEEGNFKVDIYGPEKCEHNFIHSVVKFNIDIPLSKVNTKKEAELYNYYLKTSPDFYSNLYFNSLSAEKANDLSTNKVLDQMTVHGQAVEESSEGTSGQHGQHGQPGQPESTSSSETVAESSAQGLDSAASDVPDVQKFEVVHILKHIKNSKSKTTLVKYDYYYDFGDHACSRTQASNPEKLGDCISFCNNNWDTCRRSVSPGYCLTKLKKTNECLFCFV